MFCCTIKVNSQKLRVKGLGIKNFVFVVIAAGRVLDSTHEEKFYYLPENVGASQKCFL